MESRIWTERFCSSSTSCSFKKPFAFLFNEADDEEGPAEDEDVEGPTTETEGAPELGLSSFRSNTRSKRPSILRTDSSSPLNLSSIFPASTNSPFRAGALPATVFPFLLSSFGWRSPTDVTPLSFSFFPSIAATARGLSPIPRIDNKPGTRSSEEASLSPFFSFPFLWFLPFLSAFGSSTLGLMERSCFKSPEIAPRSGP
mmetsp:Transcript_16860/g.23335  ORF Transcript_16860/g.23335 Transcript_16860/m.23335 type:complete len:200 (+) Transcript_16860:910-1509(+)